MHSTESVVRFLKTLLKLLFLNSKQTFCKHLVVLFIIQLTYTNIRAFFAVSDIRDFNKTINNLIYMLIIFLATAKLVVLAIHRGQITVLFVDISHELMKGINQQQKKRLESAGLLSYLLVRGLLAAMITFDSVMIILNMFLSGNGIQLPMPEIVNLVPGKGTAFFLANVIFQFSVFYAAALSILAADGILLFSLLYLDASLDVLADKVKNFDDKYVTEQLRDVWQYQLKVIGLKRNIENIFEGHISIQFIGSMGLLCASFYCLKGDTLMTMVIMVGMGLGEIFSICFIGQRIERKSDVMMNRLYFLPWPRFRSSDARRLAIMMLASVRPLTITTPFANLTLDTFAKVLKTTYSLYTILRTAE